MSNDAKTVGFYDRAAGEYADKFARQKPGTDLTAFMKLVRVGGTVLA